MKYYIYHIPAVKIGVTKNVKRRVIKNQGFSEYEILEEHTDIYKVSDREQQLQKQYGYKVDKIPYWQMSKIGGRGGKIQGKRNVESGHLRNISRMGYSALTKEQKSKGGKRSLELGYLAKAQKLSIEANRTPIIQYTKSGEFVKEFKSQSEASKELNLHASKINAVCNGHRKTTGGFVFKFKF